MNESSKTPEQLVLDYCEGIYRGDVALLRETIHPRAMLFGEINGEAYVKTLEEYLRIVANRVSPQAKGEPYAMKTEGLEILGGIATAKVRCPIFGYDYADRLSFVRHDGRWWLVGKVFTHIEG